MVDNTVPNVSGLSTSSTEQPEQSDPINWSSHLLLVGSGVAIMVWVFIMVIISTYSSRQSKKKNTNTTDNITKPIPNDDVSLNNDDITNDDVIDMVEEYESEPDNADEPERYLDWNKIFRFLARNIHVVSWRLLFDCLYGNTSLPPTINWSQIIDRIVLDKGSCGIEYTILEQFKAWKEAAGKNATTEIIVNSLTELGHMDTLEKFSTYMSDPPYLDVGTTVSSESTVATPTANYEAIQTPNNSLPTISILVPIHYPHAVVRNNVMVIDLEGLSLLGVPKESTDDFMSLQIPDESETCPKLVD